MSVENKNIIIVGRGCSSYNLHIIAERLVMQGMKVEVIAVGVGVHDGHGAFDSLLESDVYDITLPKGYFDRDVSAVTRNPPNRNYSPQEAFWMKVSVIY